MKKMSLRSLLKSVVQKPQEVVQAVRQPEKRFRVKFDDHTVACMKPTGEISAVQWAKLATVIYDSMPGHGGRTLNLWVLQAPGQLCVIPDGALGLEELLKRLQKLPDFKMPSPPDKPAEDDRNTFTCWQKT